MLQPPYKGIRTLCLEIRAHCLNLRSPQKNSCHVFVERGGHASCGRDATLLGRSIHRGLTVFVGAPPTPPRFSDLGLGKWPVALAETGQMGR